MLFRKNFMSGALMLINFGICLNTSFSHPAGNYREHQPGEHLETTTNLKKNKDTYQINKQVMPIPQNGSNGSKKTKPFTSNVNGKSKYNDIACDPVTDKTQATNTGKKPPQRQSDDDDDDDDGGEYEGVSDYGNCKRKDQDELQDKSKSMPMMIIRQLDVMAMDVPIPNVKDCKKPLDDDKTQTPKAQNRTDAFNRTADTMDPCDPKDPGQKVPVDKSKGKEWGSWSPCSKTCGDGIQTRTRMSPSRYQELDTQVRMCNVADCRSAPRMSADSRQPPAQFKFNEMY